MFCVGFNYNRCTGCDQHTGAIYALVMSIMQEFTQRGSTKREMIFFGGCANPLLMKYENLWYERRKKK